MTVVPAEGSGQHLSRVSGPGAASAPSGRVSARRARVTPRTTGDPEF